VEREPFALSAGFRNIRSCFLSGDSQAKGHAEESKEQDGKAVAEEK